MDTLQRTTTTGGYQVKNIPSLPSTLSDHPSLVGIIRLPFCTNIEEIVNISLPIYKDNKWQMVTQNVLMSTNIKQVATEGESFTVNKDLVTDFFPYTYYVLTDGECEPLILKPQYMPNNCILRGKFALSTQPVERYYIQGYKGDINGNIYNITNLNQMLLPTATNEGTNFLNANANTIMQNRKSSLTSNILNGIGSMGASVGAMTTGNVVASVGIGLNGLSNTINGIEHIKSIDSRVKDSTLTPNSISSFGTPSTRDAFGNNKVRLLKYSVNPNIKNKVLNFTNRYGNKYNNYASIDIKSYKGYLKVIDPKLISNIDNIYINKLKTILERGVYIE